MAAYWIVDNEITDQDLFNEFAGRIRGSMEAHGGKFLVRGGATQVIDGDRTPHRVVVVEFESMEQAQAYANSPEYQELVAIRDRSSITTAFIVEGL